jgi:prepilin-type N-terminal cleavage/methylation domain-containing protein
VNVTGHLPARTRGRRGISLVEVMVVMAILLIVMAVMVPSMRNLLDLRRREGARQLAGTFERLHDESVMRNLSFRITFYLDEDKYTIEPGKPGALIAAGPEEREKFEADLQSKLRFMTEEERVAWLRNAEQPFEGLQGGHSITTALPPGVEFAGFYTPQYGRVIRRGEQIEERTEGPVDPDADPETLKVYSYVMNTGYSEHTLVWLTNAGDPTDGWTVEVEPLSGAVRLHGELLEPSDFAWLPEEGPKLPR